MIQEIKTILGFKNREKDGLDGFTLDYENSLFKNNIIPIMFLLNIMNQFNKNIFDILDLRGLIPEFLLKYIISILRIIFIMGEFIYSNFLYIFFLLLFLIILIFSSAHIALNKKFNFAWKTSSDGFIRTLDFLVALERLTYLLLLIMSDFRIIFIFTKNILDFNMPFDEFLLLSLIFLITSTARVFYILFYKLFLLEFKEHYGKIDCEYIVNSLSNTYFSRYKILNKKIKKDNITSSSDQLSDSYYFFLKDTEMKKPNFLFLKIHSIEEITENNTNEIKYKLKELFVSDVFDEVKYVFDEQIK